MGQDTRLCRYWEGLEKVRDLLFMEPSVGPSCAGNFTDILSFNPDNNLLLSYFELRSYVTFLRSHGCK